MFKKIVDFLFKEKQEEHIIESVKSNLEEIVSNVLEDLNNKNRAAIYIDGCNLYHFVKECTGSNLSYNGLIEFCNEVVGDNSLVKIGYYFSPISNEQNPIRFFNEQNFLEGLKSIKQINLVLGRLESSKGCLVEKETDVNLAVDVISDAYENVFDTAYLISNDGDFRGVYDTVHKKFKNKKVIYVSVGADKPISNYLYISAADTIIKDRYDILPFVRRF